MSLGESPPARRRDTAHCSCRRQRSPRLPTTPKESLRPCRAASGRQTSAGPKLGPPASRFAPLHASSLSRACAEGTSKKASAIAACRHANLVAVLSHGLIGGHWVPLILPGF